MITTIAAPMPDNNKELFVAKKQFIEDNGVQAYLNSYECHLNMQWLTRTEIQKEMKRVRWNTILDMQSNYKYN